MSWTKRNGGASQNFATSTTMAVTFADTVASGDLIVVVSSRDATSNDISSDTCADDLGNTYTLGGSGYENVTPAGLAWFYVVSGFSGTPTVTVTYPATQPNRGIAAHGYRSSLGSPSLNTSSTLAAHSDLLGAGPDNLICGPITPTVDGCVIVSGWGQHSNLNAHSAGTGWTEDQDTGVASISYTALDSLVQNTAAQIYGNATDAGSAARYLGFVAAFREPAAATTGRSLLLGVG